MRRMQSVPCSRARPEVCALITLRDKKRCRLRIFGNRNTGKFVEFALMTGAGNAQARRQIVRGDAYVVRSVT